MAFVQKFLQPIGWEGSTNQFRVWRYNGAAAAVDDTLAEISADNYLAENPVRLTAGDLIVLRGSDYTGLFQVVSVTATTSVLRRVASTVLTGSATYDAPSLATTTTTTTTVTVTGAALGDIAECSFGVDLAGLTATAYVSATDTVTVVLHNPTGGTIDLASTTLRVRVKK